VNFGRLILPALRWRDDTGFDHEAENIATALRFGAGGFIIFGGQPDAVRALTTELTERAGRPLLIAADLERGAGQQFPGLTEFPPPGALGSLHNPDVISVAARTTAREALDLGINWVLAPDADLDIEPQNPIVQTRSFGGDPEMVGVDAGTWVRRCQEAGALACVKHFPGHGRTTQDSHDDVPVITADARTLVATDLVPFRIAIAAGVATIMTGHLRVPALDPSGTPATFSAPILDYLRTKLGFTGLIVTDALMMGAAVKDAADNPSVRALAAGCDVLCYPADPQRAFDAIGEAMKQGALSEERVDEAVRRYGEALLRAGVGSPPFSPQPPTPSPASGEGEHSGIAADVPPLHIMERGTGGEVESGGQGGSGAGGQSASIADRLLSQGLIRGEPPALRTPIELIVVDDDQGGAWPASPNDYVERALRAVGVPIGAGGSRVVLAFAEPRASKGRAGFGPPSLEALQRHAGADAVIVFGHPRLAAEVPGSAPLLLAWHRQRLMQDAAARWIRERLT
jgi:beta-glucosidase-like glycosyl hydrolase